jgi:hypothetical protein
MARRANSSQPGRGAKKRGTEMNSTFMDLAPTETDAAGVVGGAAFLDLTPVVTLLGVIVTVPVHID